MRAFERQRNIFSNGVSGKRPVVPVHPHRLHEKAEKAMSPKAQAYLQSAGRGQGAWNNQQAFRKWDVIPHMLSEIKSCDTSIELFGRTYATPLLLAPVGVLDLYHRTGDIEAARGADELGVPVVISNQASQAMEKTTSVLSNSESWFQLYYSKSEELVESLIKRAEQCGCTAIVVTVDTTLLGWRPEDLDQAYLPFLEGKGIAQYYTDPVFLRILRNKEFDLPHQTHKPQFSFSLIRSLLRLMRNYPGSIWKNLKTREALEAVRLFINIYSRPELSWKDISRIKEITDLPVLVKGILHAEDAQRAVEIGVDGIIVSNHGGRQIDSVLASLDALVSIKSLIGDDITVLFDSGIRTGNDVFKALALGAKAVLIGRPYVYGLTLAGKKGVAEVLNNIMAELELTMILSGVSSIAEIDSSLLKKKE